jgi:predicted amino acid racemase
MYYPRLEVHLHKIYHNAKILVERCIDQGIGIAAVTKVFCGRPEIAKVMVDAGVEMLADSRIQNIKKLQALPIPKLLLRIPMLSEIEEVVQYADISLNSEIEVMRKLSEVAIQKQKIHKVILMIDLGDLREGIWIDEVTSTVKEIIALKGVQLIGIGSNFGCYGGTIPEKKTLEKLANIKYKIETDYDIPIDIVSGGNSFSLHLLWEGNMPKEINQLRLGVPILLGREDVYNKTIQGLYDDAFRLFVEIIEIKEKPSIPIGKRGVDGFGNIPTFVDRGIRKRAIAAIGRQDIQLDGIQPTDEKILILGASSDHLILDVTESCKTFKVGDRVELKMDYGALLAAMTSEYVYKALINDGYKMDYFLA